jgi:hypothetical protein
MRSTGRAGRADRAERMADEPADRAAERERRAGSRTYGRTARADGSLTSQPPMSNATSRAPTRTRVTNGADGSAGRRAGGRPPESRAADPDGQGKGTG